MHAGSPAAPGQVEQVADAGTTSLDHDHRLCELYWSSQHGDGPASPRDPGVEPSVIVLPPPTDDAPPRSPAPPSNLPRAPPHLLSIQA